MAVSMIPRRAYVLDDVHPTRANEGEEKKERVELIKRLMRAVVDDHIEAARAKRRHQPL